ncbi:MAG: enoyl-CoA hydratase-related protein [Amphritea sp.]
MNLIVEREGRVVTLRINRPEVLNALNSELMQQLVKVATTLDCDPDIGCIILTGNDKAFAAGADIDELAGQTHLDMFRLGYFEPWDRFAALRTPVIAAVAGYALGGGCELAMMCDMIFAADNARFGQPEVKIGVTPGMGGSQRLTRLVGQSKAMDMILTGAMIDADYAERAGLVARVIALDQLATETMSAAQQIAGYSKIVTMTAKEMVRRAQEQSLSEGLLFERRSYYALYGSDDQKEGMQAFLDKRSPRFSG